MELKIMKHSYEKTFDQLFDEAVEALERETANDDITYVVTHNYYYYRFKFLTDAIDYCEKNNLLASGIVTYNDTKVNKALSDDYIFEKLQEAENDRFDLDTRIAKNGLNRLKYNLKKIGLTLQEWDMWATF